MAILKSDAYCVWYWETFQEMSWPSKLMELTFVLPPLCAAWAAHLDRGLGAIISSVAWIAIAVVLWVACTYTLSHYVRGRLAQRRALNQRNCPAARLIDRQYGY